MGNEAELCAYLLETGQFDCDWYLKEYPDVANSGMDPVLHYVRHGRQEGRKMSPHSSGHAYVQSDMPASLLENIPGRKPVAITMCTNEKYAAPLSVALESIKANVFPKNDYIIHLLYNELTLETLERLQSQETQNIRIIPYCAAGEAASLLANAPEVRYISREACLRFLIPELFPHYNRNLYLDCDIVVNEDPARLFWIDMHDAPLAAVPDNWMIPTSVAYRRTVLGNDCRKYFNSGILLFDIPRVKSLGANKECLRRVGAISSYLNPDQDLLNQVYKGRVRLLPMTWNFGWQPYVKDGYKFFDQDQFREFASYFNKPAIVHYVSDLKPWEHNDGHFSAMFWRYAKTSPFLEDLIASCPFDLNPVWDQIDNMEL